MASRKKRKREKEKILGEEKGGIMKKFLSVVLSACMALTFAGCGAGQDGKAVYDAANKKTQELTALDVSYTMDMKMKQGEETMDISSNMAMKMDAINSENMRIYAEGVTSTEGQNIDTKMYYENGYYYMEAAGQKFKYAMDLETMMETAKQSMGGGTVETDYLSEVKVKKDGDNQILTFTADASKMDSYVQEIMASMSSMPGLEGVTYTIKEVSGEATVNKDGYFSQVNIKMSMDMAMGAENVSMDMTMNTTYNNIGQPVEITTPDLDSYQEIDPSLLGM